MSFVPLRPAPVACRLFIFGALAILAGCQKEEDVRHYTTPKEQALPAAAAETGDRPLQHLLGAIIPRGDDLWVFKLMGPDAAVKGHEAEFEAFMDSVAFKDGAKEPSFKAPESWRKSEGTRFSVAAFHVGPEPQAPELTVTPSRGSVFDNINRWRGQLGLKPADAEEIKRTSKEKKLGKDTAVLVDLTGTGGGGMGQPPFAGKSHPPIGRAPKSVDASPPKLKYTLPNGWEEGGELVKGGIPRIAVFQVKDGGKSAEVAVTIAGGDVRANIDRWRGQVGLGPASDEQFEKETSALKIDGNPALYVDLSREGKPDQPGILGAVLPRGQETWFFKMVGPADLVGRNKPAFEAFLKSVRLPGGAAND
jgi:hypothetical protein